MVAPDKLAVFTETLEQTNSIAAAARAVGYSDASADRGRANLSKPYLSALEVWEKAQREMEIADKLTKDNADRLVRGSLARVIATGKDSDVVAAAAKLGTHKEYDLFATEKQVGVMMVIPSEVLGVITERLQQRAPVGQLPPVIEAESVVPPSDVTKE
jgi:hypothetical protein